MKPIIFDADSVRAILAGRKTQTRRVIRRVVVTVGGDATKLRNPYMVGDLLYVKEPWESWANTGRANGEAVDMMRPWRSPIFMPRACARMLLEIVSVRVERVQEITEADCIAEGIAADTGGHPRLPGCAEKDDFRSRWDALNAKRGYPWASNPWVWAIEFRTITAAVAQRIEQPRPKGKAGGSTPPGSVNHSPSTAGAADGGAGADENGAPSRPVRQAGQPNTPTAADAAGEPRHA